MNAIQMQQYGNEDELKLVDIPKPQAGLGQVVVRVVAASYNPIDRKRASGAMRQIFPLQFPHTPGIDFSGVIDSLGEGVQGLRVGDAVIGYSIAAGAYAEFVAVDANSVTAKPKSVNDVEAASLSLVAQTAIQMLDMAEIGKGKTVLIHGAGGAVGGVAVQVAHRRGAAVIATASARSAARVKEYGADKVIDYTREKFEDETGKVDAVLDLVGGDIQRRSYGVLKPGGVLIAAGEPPSQEEAAKYNVRASMVMTQVTKASLEQVAKLIDAGEIKPFVGRVYPLSEAAQGWRDEAARRVDGKLVFTVGA
jgi:NADPH:quinone reductase-like Zn-dependent oxidoreductase